MRPVLERRAAATRATMERFRDKPFKLGRNDCARMVSYHLRRIGRPVKSARAGTYHSPLGAKRALRLLGYENLAALMDAHFVRIPPAAALVGDIIQLESDDETIGALTVAVGNGRVLGYHEGASGGTVMQPSEYVAAWRVL